MAEVTEIWLRTVAWVVIATVVVLALAQTQRRHDGPPKPQPARLVEVMVRMAVGRYSLANAVGHGASVGLDALPAEGDDVPTRVAVAVGAGELGGSEEARRRLAAISDDRPAVAADLERLRLCYEGGPVDPVALRSAWGWSGDLAAVHGLPAGDPRREAALRPAITTVYTWLGIFAAVVLALLAGLGLALTAIARWHGGMLRAAPAAPAGDSSCLLAFAAYLVGFNVFGLVAHLVMGRLGVPQPAFGATWLFLPVAAAVAAIPRLRGWSWPDLRQAVGLHRGRGVLREIGAGLLGYLAGLPLVGLGVAATTLLSRWFPVDHPVSTELVAHAATTAGALGILALASGFAPVVEETMFRGLFLHHLRRHGQVVAVLVSAVVFAAIHPQGVAGIPVIASIGVVLALIRTWRGSLIASITAHALHNGLQVAVILLLMG
jgi:membrane protease YdiL (CAAX protease family)